MASSGIWECKIGEAEVKLLPEGCDAPMRKAVINAYYELTGHYPDYCFSGWGASLTDIEQECVEETS